MKQIAKFAQFFSTAWSYIKALWRGLSRFFSRFWSPVAAKGAKLSARAKFIPFFFGILILTSVSWAGTFGPVVKDSVKNTMCGVAPRLSSQAYKIPKGAIWRKEKIRQEKTPEGHSAAVAWINAATPMPCNFLSTPATVEIRKMRIIEQEVETGAENLLQTITFGENREGFAASLHQRLPNWFGPGKGGDSELLEHHLPAHQIFLINLTYSPDRIYHGWTHPRVPVRPNTRLIVEAEVRITGAARVQFGVDYWRDMDSDYAGYDEACQTSNNCEAWISKWYGDTKARWKTIRAPKDFE